MRIMFPGRRSSRVFIVRALAISLAAAFASFPVLVAQEIEEAPVPVRKRISFWRFEQNQALGDRAVLVVPFDNRVALFRNRRPLQFHGWGGFLHRHVPDLADGQVLEREMQDITPLLRANPGQFILIGLPRRGGMEVDFSREQYTLLAARIKGVMYNVINIVVTKEGRIQLEAEREERYGESGEYFHWDVESVFVMYRK